MSEPWMAADAGREPLPHRLELGALGTLFRLSLRQQIRGKRLIILALLYLLPIALAMVAHSTDENYKADDVEVQLLWTFLPHTLVPLTALLCAGGIIHDEIEEQTLTYLLIRPLPRWGIYLAKLLATMFLTMAFASLFNLLSYLAVFWGEPNLWGEIVPRRVLLVSGITCLALAAYCALFGLLGFLTRWPLVVGIGYIALFEGIVANIDFAVRKLTVNYYFRATIQACTERSVTDWRIEIAKSPAAAVCAVALLAIAGVATLLATALFNIREFRVKTPE